MGPKPSRTHIFLPQQNRYIIFNLRCVFSERNDTLLMENVQEKSSVRVSTNNNAPEPVPARSCVKKEHIHLNDLPEDMRDLFRDTIVPTLREFAGLLAPWQNPKEEDIRDAWACCSPTATAYLDDGTYFVLSKLVCTL
jgi:hypothetical protein